MKSPLTVMIIAAAAAFGSFAGVIYTNRSRESAEKMAEIESATQQEKADRAAAATAESARIANASNERYLRAIRDAVDKYEDVNAELIQKAYLARDITEMERDRQMDRSQAERDRAKKDYEEGLRKAKP